MIPNMGKKVVDILAQNLVRNCGPGYRFDTITELGRKSGVGKSTIDRLKKGESAVRIDNLEGIASAYGLAAWQMLVPDIDTNNPPELLGDGLSPGALIMLRLFNALGEPEQRYLIEKAQAFHRDLYPSNLDNKSRDSA